MKKVISLTIIAGLTIGFSFLYFYFSDGHLFKDSIPLYLTFSAFCLLAASFVGVIFWILFSRRKNRILSFLISSNYVGLGLIVTLNLVMLYKNWHYKHYQSNIEYNESLRKQGGYFDTCMTFAQNSIIRQVDNPNNFRILSYSYNNALTTIPRDTSNQFYDFVVIYRRYQGSGWTIRVAKYLANTRHDFRQIFDLDFRDERAKAVVDNYRNDFIGLKENLDKIDDSNDQSLSDLRKALEFLK